MPERRRFPATLAATLAAALLLPAPAAGEEPAPQGEAKPQDRTPEKPPEKPGEKAKPALKTLSDVEAAPLLVKLRDAAKTKKPDEGKAALAAIAGVTHPAFEAALARLLSHASVEVATAAAAAIAERGDAKSGAPLWKGWLHATNAKRLEVKGAILEAMGAVKAPLDAKQYDDVEGIWRQAPSIEAMNSVTTYFRLMATDKRPCKMLATWLDEPKVGNVNDPNNPPAGWWQARWTLWSKTKPGAVAALKAITGQAFDSSADARAWFEANPKFGVRW
jgi:hypothetical protein